MTAIEELLQKHNLSEDEFEDVLEALLPVMEDIGMLAFVDLSKYIAEHEWHPVDDE